MAKASKTPLLDALEAAGIVWAKPLEWEGGKEWDWFARASDGELMGFGISTRAKIERYLRDYPTPDMW